MTDPVAGDRRDAAAVTSPKRKPRTLAEARPEVLDWWDHDANGGLTAHDIRAGSNQKVVLRCPDCGGRWKQAAHYVARGATCPCHHQSFTRSKAAALLDAMRDHYGTLDPSVLYVVAMHGWGLTPEQAQLVVNATDHLGLPREPGDDTHTGDDTEPELTVDSDSDLENLPGLADLDTDTDTDGDTDTDAGTGTGGPHEPAMADFDDTPPHPDQHNLPEPTSQQVIKQHAKAAVVLNGTDAARTIKYVIARGIDRLWRLAYTAEANGNDPATVLNDIRTTRGDNDTEDAYLTQIRDTFEAELLAALDVTPPPGWAFGHPPTLMQRRVVTKVASKRSVANLSGTGAGKTISAILTARTLGAGQDGVVVVVAPNNVLATWRAALASTYPDTRVATRTFRPTWAPGTGPRWLLLNYEAFQSDKATAGINNLVRNVGVDMLVLDEVHLGKKRGNTASSKRREQLLKMRRAIKNKRRLTPVLAMTATPVINDLIEPASVLELVTGKKQNLPERVTVPNAMIVHQALAEYAVREVPNYGQDATPTVVPVDANTLYQEVYDLGPRPDMTEVERTLLKAKIPAIVDACAAAVQRGSKALVYTDLVEDMAQPILRALRAAGITAMEYTGTEKADLSRFTGMDEGRPVQAVQPADVLVGSRVIGTGVDGLQKVADTVVFACLPWTEAEYQQVVGRLIRKGRDPQHRHVHVIVPSTFIDIPNPPEGHDGKWRWDERRLARIDYKRSLAGVVLDGQLVDRSDLISRAEFTRGLVSLLHRLDTDPTGDVETGVDQGDQGDQGDQVPEDEVQLRRRRAAASAFTRMNARWCRDTSEATHRRLARDRREWEEYHAQYTQVRQGWATVPAEHFAAALDQRTAPRRVADLGCGQMLLADAMTTTHHTVVGFDHVAFDERVQVADIANLHMVKDGEFDIAVLSLALMGSNTSDYLREAWRILRPEGSLWLAEMRSKVGDDEDRIREALLDHGFALVDLAGDARFAILTATRSSRLPLANPQPFLRPLGAMPDAA